MTGTTSAFLNPVEIVLETPNQADFAKVMLQRLLLQANYIHKRNTWMQLRRPYYYCLSPIGFEWRRE
jgi:hypothetical protein